MNLITVEGTEAEVRDAGDVAGFLPSKGSARRIGADHWLLSGYATDAAVGKIQAVGAIVTIHRDNEQMEQLFDELDAEDTDSPGVG